MTDTNVQQTMQPAPALQSTPSAPLAEIPKITKSFTPPDDDIDDLDLDLDGMNIDENIDTSVSLLLLFCEAKTFVFKKSSII